MSEAHDTKVGPNETLLALFGLTVEEAGVRVGCSWASIRAGFSEGRGGRNRPVLNQVQVIQLRLLEHLLEKRTSDEEAVIGQLHDRYGKEVADETRAAFERMAIPCQLESYEEVWMLVPDIRRTIKSSRAGYLRDLLQFPGKLTFYTGSPVDDEALQAYIGTEAIAVKSDSLTFKWDTPVGCWPDMLLGNPHSAVDRYWRGMTKFVRSPDLNESYLVFFLEELAAMSPLQRLLRE